MLAHSAWFVLAKRAGGCVVVPLCKNTKKVAIYHMGSGRHSIKKIYLASVIVFLAILAAFFLQNLTIKIFHCCIPPFLSFLYGLAFALALTIAFICFHKRYMGVLEKLHNMFNDEKRLRDALKKAEDKYRAIFDESSDGIMLIEKNTGAIVDFNENMLSILGCSHEEIPSLDVRKIEYGNRDNIAKLIGPEQLDLFTEKKSLGFKTKIISKNGIKVDVIANVKIILISDKQYILLVCKDISTENHTERRLLDQMQFSNTLLEVSPAPIFYKNKDGKYLGCNAAFEKFVGIKRDKLVGKTVFDISPRNIAEEYFKKDQELFENPGVQIYDWKVARSDGAIRDVIFHKATYADKKGNVAGLIGTISDVTDLRKKSGV